MKNYTPFLSFLFIFLPVVLSAQNNAAYDDSFDIFLMLIATQLICGMIVAAIAGAFLAMFFLTVICISIAAGILSVSILTGWYKKSLRVGAKTFVSIIASVTGALMGIGGVQLWEMLSATNHLISSLVLWAAIGGLIGGYFTGRIVLKAIGIAYNFMHKKFTAAS